MYSLHNHTNVLLVNTKIRNSYQSITLWLGEKYFFFYILIIGQGPSTDCVMEVSMVNGQWIITCSNSSDIEIIIHTLLESIDLYLILYTCKLCINTWLIFLFIYMIFYYGIYGILGVKRIIVCLSHKLWPSAVFYCAHQN